MVLTFVNNEKMKIEKNETIGFGYNLTVRFKFEIWPPQCIAAKYVYKDDF